MKEIFELAVWCLMALAALWVAANVAVCMLEQDYNQRYTEDDDNK